VTRRLPVLALAAALALTGCRDGGGKPHVVVQTVFLDRLSAAIRQVNTTRQRLADDGATLDTAARKLDDVDAVAVTGSRDAVRARRPAAAAAAAKAATVAGRLSKDVTAYDRAVAALDAANGTGLDATQQQAVGGVVTAGHAEVGQLRTYATVIATIWPRYAALDENQSLWLARASNGWYRDQKEAAGGYATLTDRAGLDAARRSLGSADARRLAVARQASEAIRAARGALASLLG